MFFLLGAVGLNVYAALLVLLRAVVYRTHLYRPMLLNIMLSILPVFILMFGFLAGALVAQASYAGAVAVWLLTGIVWLLMLPNSSYLITELNLSHRSNEDSVPLWYDIILVITLAMSGVVNTIINVLIVHVIAATTVFGDNFSSLTRPVSWSAVACVLLLLGFGMYLGRYLRLNSWDIKHPLSFLRKVFTHFRVLANVWACLGFTITYAIFLGLIYLIVGGLVIDLGGAIETLQHET
ncbi:MAG: DUF1361 domain-containing protein [Leucobacter sp.]|nr:DUF1361 domain-containing protein [Leucobacter sp.]